MNNTGSKKRQALDVDGFTKREKVSEDNWLRRMCPLQFKWCCCLRVMLGKP